MPSACPFTPNTTKSTRTLFSEAILQRKLSHKYCRQSFFSIPYVVSFYRTPSQLPVLFSPNHTANLTHSHRHHYHYHQLSLALRFDTCDQNGKPSTPPFHMPSTFYHYFHALPASSKDLTPPCVVELCFTPSAKDSRVVVNTQCLPSSYFCSRATMGGFVIFAYNNIPSEVNQAPSALFYT